ncbi:MAG: diguanylate cyclase [Pseudoxanthomonas sp.]
MLRRRRGLAAFAVLVLCLLAGCGGAAFAAASALQLPVRIELLGTGSRAHASADGKGVVLPADGRPARFRLHFLLPPVQEGGSPWQLRFNRAAIDELALSRAQWRPPAQSYYYPLAHDGLLPMAFTQSLPYGWSGAVSVDVQARSDQLATLRPQLMHPALGQEYDQRSLALAVAIYAGVAVLALVALSLLAAARELAFTSFLWFMASSLLLMLVANGHAYSLPWLNVMAPLGGRGINIASLMVSASGIAVAREFTGRRPDSHWLRWLPEVGVIAILCGALACLLGLVPDAQTAQKLVTAGWIVAASLAMVAFASATLRKAWLGWPLLAAILILGLTCTLFELSIRGIGGEFWGRFGYQVGLFFIGLVLVVALIGRIADFRVRHDHERTARKASESRLEQQQAYAALALELRRDLPGVLPMDMEWNGIQRAMARLLPLLQLESVAILLYRAGYDPIMISEPARHSARMAGLTAANEAALRDLAQRQLEVADLALVVAPEPGAAAVVRAYAAVPLKASGGIGLAVLERADTRVFLHEELALATRFGLLVQEVTAEARANHSLRRAAELDVLTGILNRNAIDTALVQQFAQAHRQQQPLSILFVDLDNFKAVNDRNGHAAGDHCLRQLAAILQRVLGPGDGLGRYGGEEFMVILPGQTGDFAVQVGERLRALVENAQVEWQGQIIPLTVSVGVGVREAQEQSPTEALARADRALYAAKHAGRNMVNMGN